MGKRYPRIELCDYCDGDFLHAHIYESEDERSDRPMYSEEDGEGMIKFGEKDGLLTKKDAERLTKQLHELSLPKTQEDAWNSFSEETKELFREEARKQGLL